MAENERTELLNPLNRCRDLLMMMRDPAAKKTITDLVAYLETKLAAMVDENHPG